MVAEARGRVLEKNGSLKLKSELEGGESKDDGVYEESVGSDDD